MERIEQKIIINVSKADIINAIKTAILTNGEKEKTLVLSNERIDTIEFLNENSEEILHVKAIITIEKVKDEDLPF